MKKIFLVFFLLLLPILATAGILPQCGYCDERGCQRPCNWCDFFQLIINIINFLLFSIAPPLAVLFISIAGLILIVGHFFPGYIEVDKVNLAKNILITVVFALGLMYGAWLLVDLFFKIFAPGFNWKNLPC